MAMQWLKNSQKAYVAATAIRKTEEVTCSPETKESFVTLKLASDQEEDTVSCPGPSEYIYADQQGNSSCGVVRCLTMQRKSAIPDSFWQCKAQQWDNRVWHMKAADFETKLPAEYVDKIEVSLSEMVVRGIWSAWKYKSNEFRSQREQQITRYSSALQDTSRWTSESRWQEEIRTIECEYSINPYRKCTIFSKGTVYEQMFPMEPGPRGKHGVKLRKTPKYQEKRRVEKLIDTKCPQADVKNDSSLSISLKCKCS